MAGRTGSPGVARHRDDFRHPDRDAIQAVTGGKLAKPAADERARSICKVLWPGSELASGKA